jgi:geranylgeranyl pyrophosphate synthase
MVDGQAFDLGSEGKTLSLEQLKRLHAAKTGELIRASLRLGALVSGHATDVDLEELDRYAQKIGLAFQIQDDILDIESTTEQLGKPQGSDEERDKATYPSLIGLEQSKSWLNELHQEAIEALEPFGSRNRSLIDLADFVIARNH